MMDKNSSLTKNIQIKKKQIWYLRIITNEKKWSKIETVFWDAAETCSSDCIVTWRGVWKLEVTDWLKHKELIS